MWRTLGGDMTTTPVYFGETVSPHNATFAGHKASTFNVEESLRICKQLFEHSWKSYTNENYNLVWRDALDTAIQGCKGLLTMATEKTCAGAHNRGTYLVCIIPNLFQDLPHCCSGSDLPDKHDEAICEPSKVLSLVMGAYGK